MDQVFPASLWIPGFGLAAFVLAASCVWLLQVAATEEVHAALGSPESVTIFRRRWDELQNYLLSLGVLLALGVLMVGAQRLALTAQVDPHTPPVPKAPIARFNEQSIFPALMVQGFGAYMSLLVALVYVPTFWTLQKLGGEIVAGLVPEDGADDWEAVAKKRHELEESLRLKITLRQSFESLAPILLPLIGGLVSGLAK